MLSCFSSFAPSPCPSHCPRAATAWTASSRYSLPTALCCTGTVAALCSAPTAPSTRACTPTWPRRGCPLRSPPPPRTTAGTSGTGPCTYTPGLDPWRALLWPVAGSGTVRDGGGLWGGGRGRRGGGGEAQSHALGGRCLAFAYCGCFVEQGSSWDLLWSTSFLSRMALGSCLSISHDTLKDATVNISSRISRPCANYAICRCMVPNGPRHILRAERPIAGQACGILVRSLRAGEFVLFIVADLCPTFACHMCIGHHMRSLSLSPAFRACAACQEADSVPLPSLHLRCVAVCVCTRECVYALCSCCPCPSRSTRP